MRGAQIRWARPSLTLYRRDVTNGEFRQAIWAMQCKKASGLSPQSITHRKFVYDIDADTGPTKSMLRTPQKVPALFAAIDNQKNPKPHWPSP